MTGPPKRFERDKVLESVMGVFWAHGYDGTSIDMLVKASGINRSSMYASFGDKTRLARPAVRGTPGREVEA